MSLVLSLCLMVPGVCEVPELDGYLEAMSVTDTTDPVDRWRPLVALHFPPEEIDRALCIIGHESNGDPEADNPRSTARGLFQILGSLWAPHYGISRADLYDPVLNTRLARDIWDNYGWSAWSPYQRGSCR